MWLLLSVIAQSESRYTSYAGPWTPTARLMEQWTVCFPVEFDRALVRSVFQATLPFPSPMRPEMFQSVTQTSSGGMDRMSFVAAMWYVANLVSES